MRTKRVSARVSKETRHSYWEGRERRKRGNLNFRPFYLYRSNRNLQRAQFSSQSVSVPIFNAQSVAASADTAQQNGGTCKHGGLHRDVRSPRHATQFGFLHQHLRFDLTPTHYPFIMLADLSSLSRASSINKDTCTSSLPVKCAERYTRDRYLRVYRLLALASPSWKTLLMKMRWFDVQTLNGSCKMPNRSLYITLLNDMTLNSANKKDRITLLHD